MMKEEKENLTISGKKSTFNFLGVFHKSSKSFYHFFYWEGGGYINIYYTVVNIYCFVCECYYCIVVISLFLFIVLYSVYLWQINVSSNFVSKLIFEICFFK